MGLKKQIIQFKDGKEIATYNSATEAANAIESTKFRENLHIYMITHPQYFPNYTGMRVLNAVQPQRPITNSSNMNIGTEDIPFS